MRSLLFIYNLFPCFNALKRGCSLLETILTGEYNFLLAFFPRTLSDHLKRELHLSQINHLLIYNNVKQSENNKGENYPTHSDTSQ